MFSLTCNLNKKRRRIFTHPNFVEKSTCKQRGFFDHQNYIKKINGNKNVRELFLVETTWIFWPSKFHRKMYVETTWIFRSAKLYWKRRWKFVEIWPSTYRRNVDVDPTWCARWENPYQKLHYQLFVILVKHDLYLSLFFCFSIRALYLRWLAWFI